MNVVAYARVSTTRQAEKDLSIPDELLQIREWCKNEGHNIVDEFIDVDVSAKDDKRPEFQRMMKMAYSKPTGFNAIIVRCLSRFFRDNIQLVLHGRNLDKNRVKLISITQITQDAANGELIRMKALFDAHHSKANGAIS